MFKVLKALLLVPAMLPTNVSRFSVPAFSYKNKFDYIEIPPLNLPGGGSTAIKVKVSFSESKIHTCSIIIKNDSYPSGKILYTLSRRSKSMNFTYDYDNEYTKVNSILEFQATDASALSVYPEMTNYPIISPATYTPNSLVNIYYHGKEYGWQMEREYFEFRNFTDYYVPDYYHKVDFSEFSIYREAASSTGVPYTRASVLIDNYQGIFSDIGSLQTNGTQVHVPLLLVQDDNHTCHFEFKETMYVHQTTLKMSLTQKEGYVQTRQLYLPKRGMAEQENYKLQFSIVDLGGSKALFTHRMSVKAPIDTVGSSATAEYYVSVSNSSPELELGDVEEH